MEDRLENGKKVRILNVIHEFTRECLASEVAFSIKQHDVTELPQYLFLVRGCSAYLRSVNGSQFTATRVKRFLENHTEVFFLEIKRGYLKIFLLEEFWRKLKWY